MPLPRLSTVVLRDPDVEKVKELVAARKATGVPIRRLLLQQSRRESDTPDLDTADALWFSQNLEVFAVFSSEEDKGYKPLSMMSPVDRTLQRLSEADLAAERDGVSFMDVSMKS